MYQLTQTPNLVLFNIIVLFCLVGLTYNAFRSRRSAKGKNAFIILMCFVFCIFSFWGADWFGYQEYFQMLNWVSSSKVPMEGFYLWLMEDVCSSYLQFRIIVWGISLLFLLLTLRNLHLDIGLALFFFCSIYLIYFSYARVTLAITMMFYGYSYIGTGKGGHRVFRLLWGLLWIILSFYFHKSAILGIVTLFVALIVMKMGKKGPLLILFAFPVMLMLMNTVLNDYFQMLTMEDGILSDYANTGAVYLEMQDSKIGISTWISWILERTPYYLLAYTSFKELYKPSAIHPKIIRAFFMAEFLIIVFASVFLFDFGVNTSTLYGRFLRFAQVPSLVVFTYFYTLSYVPRSVKAALGIGLVNCLYAMTYSYYNTFTI